MKKILGITGGVVGVLLFIIYLSLEKIPAGYVGVVYSPNGGVKEKPLNQGWHFVNPFYKVTEYTIATEQAFLSRDSKEGSREDDSFYVPTSDGKLVNVDVEYSYRFNPDMVTEVFTKFRGRTGEQIQKNFMRGKIKTWVSEVTSKFNVLDIYGAKRTELNTLVFQHVKDEFAPYGIIIESVNLSRIGLDEATARAIQARVNAQQELEKQKIEKAKAAIEAERRAIEEEGRRQVLLIQAKAEAESILLRAQAQSEANEKISKSLTKELVEYEKIKKWNGELPQVTGETIPMIDLTKTK
nr:prohibitin family protein [uncultured Cetobacterium sp.]